MLPLMTGFTVIYDDELRTPLPLRTYALRSSGSPGRRRQTAGLSVMLLFGVARNVLRNHERAAVRSAQLIGKMRSEGYVRVHVPPEGRQLQQPAGLHRRHPLPSVTGPTLTRLPLQKLPITAHPSQQAPPPNRFLLQPVAVTSGPRWWGSSRWTSASLTRRTTT